jgi:hypothetical protein
MSLELRPTFTIGLDEPTGVVLRRLRAQMAAPHVQVRWAQKPGGGTLSHVREDTDHVVLCMDEDVRHFWSPWLMMDVQAEADTTHLFGRFSPHPSVWTGFAFCYLTLSVVGFFSLIFTAALHMSGSGHAWVGLIAPLCALIALALWWASQIGQRLAQAQMLTLRECVAAAVNAPATATASADATMALAS